MTEIQEGSKVARLSAIVRLTTFADNSPHVTYPDLVRDLAEVLARLRTVEAERRIDGRVAEAREKALQPYLRHRYGCAGTLANAGPGECTCGLAALACQPEDEKLSAGRFFFGRAVVVIRLAKPRVRKLAGALGPRAAKQPTLRVKENLADDGPWVAITVSALEQLLAELPEDATRPTGDRQ